jgi:hypothetical protein
MKIQRLLIVLTLVNTVLLAFSLAQSHTVAAQDVAPVLRGRALQIVDDRGRVRASIQVLPATTQKDSSLSYETVLLAADHRERASISENWRVGGERRVSPCWPLGHPEYVRTARGDGKGQLADIEKRGRQRADLQTVVLLEPASDVAV